MQSNTIDYARSLYDKGFICGPGICSCGSNKFNIYKDAKYKVNNCSFTCCNYKCRKQYSITINSFFDAFSRHKLKDISEVIKCFLCYEYNIQKAYKYLNEELKICISEKTIRRVYQKMREVICKYLKIFYQSEQLGTDGEKEYFSVDESLINHFDGKQVWLIGICNNKNKDFRIESSYHRDAETLKSFIETYANKNSYIITDGWPGYSFLENHNSGYTRIAHIHGGGDFGFSLESTSHIESIWAQIKSKIKESYHLYPHKVFLYFMREIEFKIRIRNLTYNDKIKKFFEIYDLSKSVDDKYLLSDSNAFLNENLNLNIEDGDGNQSDSFDD